MEALLEELEEVKKLEKTQKLNIEKPAEQQLIAEELVVVSGVSVLSVWGFARITRKLIRNNLQPFRTDMKIMEMLRKGQTPKITKFMRFITNFASVKVLPWIAAGVTAAFFASKKNRARSYEIPVVSVGSGILNLLFKSKYRRDRPEHEEEGVSGWSYPSGHAMESMSFYGFLIYLLFRTKRPLVFAIPATSALAVLIFLIGLSRSYLRVHYPSDVVAGYSVGFLWLVSSISTIRMMEFFYRKEPELLHIQKTPS